MCVVSQRKKPLIVIEGFLYRRNRDNYWRCIRCSSQKCRASLILNEDSYTLCITEHTHEPETEKLRNREMMPFHMSLLAPPQSRKSSIKEEKFCVVEHLETSD
jgi:hypothetical protein